MAVAPNDLGAMDVGSAADDLGAIDVDLGAVPVAAAEPPEPTTEDVRALNKRRAKLRAEEIAAGAFEPGFVERYGLPTAAFLQGFSSATLPFVAGGIEELAGVTPKEQLALREENPVASGLGTVGGIAAGVIATGGIGGAAEVTGAKAAEAAAAAGAGRLAQAAAAAEKAALVGSRGSLVASGFSPLALAARVGAATKAATTAALPVLGETVAGKIAAGTAQALAEGAIISTALEADEARLEGREMHGGAILHGALVSGGIGGLLSGGVEAPGAFGQTQYGRRLAQKAGDTAAVRVLKKFGATASEILRAKKQIGETRYFSVLNDAERFGLVRPTMSIAKSSELADDMLTRSGEVIGAFADEAGVRAAASPLLMPQTSKILERISDEVVRPLAATVEGQGAATRIADRLETLQQLHGERIPVKALTDLRSDISKTIYGLRGTKDPLLSRESAALRQMRGILTETISHGLEKAGIDPKAWKVAQRQYEVARRIDDLAEQAQLRAQATTAGVGGLLKELPIPGIGAVAGYLHGGMTEAATAAVGLKMLKYGASVVLDWAPGAFQRALESGAPKPIVRDLQRFAEEHEEQLRGGLSAAQAAEAAMRLSPEEAARRQYLGLWSQVDAAQKALTQNPQMQGPGFSVYRRALKEAKSAMETTYYGNIPRGTKLFSPFAASPDFVDRAAGTLQAVEESLSPLARLGPGRTLLHSGAVSEVAYARNAIRESLASSPSWGTKYNEEAIRRINNAAATMVDPSRVEALTELERMTRSLQSKAQTKTDQLMGIAKGTAIKSAQTRDRDIKRGARKIYEVIGGRVVERTDEDIEIEDALLEQQRLNAKIGGY